MDQLGYRLNLETKCVPRGRLRTPKARWFVSNPVEQIIYIYIYIYIIYRLTLASSSSGSGCLSSGLKPWCRSSMTASKSSLKTSYDSSSPATSPMIFPALSTEGWMHLSRVTPFGVTFRNSRSYIWSNDALIKDTVGCRC